MFGFRKAPPARASSEPIPAAAKSEGNYFDDEDDDWGRKPSSTAKDKNSLESKSVQELEDYAVSKAEDTTKSVNNCLRIAEDIREDATRTLDMLHQQGEQITRTHNMVVETEKDLSRGEKLLNNLGGMFSKPWKPKKTREIQGPVITPDNPSKKNIANKEDREKLGLSPMPKGRSAPTTPPNEPANAYQKVDVEKAKQDDALSDLSDILGDLKGMAIGMGTELDRQNKALDNLSDDVDELNSRVKGANQRARKLVGK
ncbi:putative SNAP25 homologous protein SNAP30 [Abrus precatorius]|uniref:SNAP25 homologous protein SNAP30 n=1 Tax=Abrus precatorius TaxID=3816 RepID=A0A8B8M487_ABRPR|nr:putative SNAP25 homologous protein SNAP30 [Abrus precatorius]